MFSPSLSHITAEAATPEQVVPYVLAVSGRQAVQCGPFAAYVHEGHAVLAAFPDGAQYEEWHEAWQERAQQAAALEDDRAAPGDDAPPCMPAALVEMPDFFAAMVSEALAALPEGIGRVTVLAPCPPPQAPEQAVAGALKAVDCYWSIAVPPAPPAQKLRNMLSRAAKDVSLVKEDFGPEHEALVRASIARRPYPTGTRSIFAALGRYMQAPGARPLLLSARTKGGGLAAFSIGEYASLATAMYMFSFRDTGAPPGTADLLLQGLVLHAAECGHTRMNLGLGIDGGIRFFKKKWRAEPMLPYTETSWELRPEKPGLLAGLLGRFRKGA